jgi:hypothetical protein
MTNLLIALPPPFEKGPCTYVKKCIIAFLKGDLYKVAIKQVLKWEKYSFDSELRPLRNSDLLVQGIKS